MKKHKRWDKKLITWSGFIASICTILSFGFVLFNKPDDKIVIKECKNNGNNIYFSGSNNGVINIMDPMSDLKFYQSHYSNSETINTLEQKNQEEIGQLDLEIQLASFPLWPERSAFYLAKMYAGAIQKGQSGILGHLRRKGIGDEAGAQLLARLFPVPGAAGSGRFEIEDLRVLHPGHELLGAGGSGRPRLGGKTDDLSHREVVPFG